MKIFRVLVGIIIVILAVYSTITKNLATAPYILLLLAISNFLLGINEIQKNKYSFWGYVGLGSSLLIFFASILGFIAS